MPFVLLGIGLILLVAGVRGTQNDLYSLLKGDFSGSPNFIFWLVSILVIGALGYVPKLKGISDAFLALILLVLFVSNKGFFNKFNQQISAGVAQ